MKKKYFLPILGCALFLLIMGNDYAQKMTEFTWDTYHMKFQFPETFKININTTSEFAASDKDCNLSIQPKPGAAMSFSEMKQAIEDWALNSHVYGYGKVNQMENLNGYQAVYIDGTKCDNNQPTSLLILVHPSYSTIIIYVSLNYSSTNYNTTLKILMSFTPTY